MTRVSQSSGRDAQRAPLASNSYGPVRARVLIIDDEAAVLRAYTRILGTEHHVTVAWGGNEALALLDTQAQFDLILCDVMMPDVNGIGIYRHLHTHRPDLLHTLVFCSGGVFTSELRRQLDVLPNCLLEKPVAPARLRLLARESTAQRYANV